MVKPSETSELVYLFTATHCLKDVKSVADLAVEMYNPIGKSFTEFKFNDGIKRIDDPAADLSILEISAVISHRNIPFIAVSLNYEQDEKYFLRGFPQAVNALVPEEDYGVLQTPSGRVIKGNSNHTKMGQTCLTEELIKGFSGSGLFVQRGAAKVLIGVVNEYNGGLNRFEGVNFEGINLLLRNSGLEEVQFSISEEAQPETSNPELVGSLNSQLKAAEEQYEHLMPFSALTAVGKLIATIQDSSIPAKEKKILNAKSCYLKANCLREDTEVPNQEYNNLFIKAYKLYPQPVKHKERAARAHLDLNQPVESLLIIEKILEEDPLNAYALAIKCQIDPETVVDTTIAQSPIFKRLKVHYLLKKDGNATTDTLAEIFQEEREALTVPDNISREELSYWWYVAQYVMQDCLVKIKVYNFNRPANLKNDTALKYANDLLERISKRVKGSEIQNSLTFRVVRFDFWFTQYLISRNEQAVLKMYEIFVGTSSENQISSPFEETILPISKDVSGRISSLCICLLEIKGFAKVSNLLEENPNERRGLLWQLGGYAFSQLENHEKALQYFIGYLNEIKLINETDVINISKIIEYLYEQEWSVDQIWDLIASGKSFENESLSSLLMAFCFRFDDTRHNEVRELCSKIDPSNFVESRFKFMYVACLMALGDLAKAEEILAPLIDFNEPSAEFQWYIMCLLGMKTKTDRLLDLLSHWRLNLKPSYAYVDLELDILEYIRDYPAIEDAAKVGLNTFPNNPKYWFSMVNAIVRDAKPEKLEEVKGYMGERAIAMAAKMEWRRAFRLAGLCTIVGLRDLGKEILYNTLQIHADNSLVKHAYLTADVVENESDPFKHPEVAVENCVIRLKDDAGKGSVLNLKPSSLESNPIAALAIGKRVGESFIYNKSLGNAKTYTITMIFDKYVGQKVLLYDEFEKNPAAQPEVESMNIIDEGGFEGMTKKFIEMFGASGSMRKDAVKEIFEDFKNKKIGFTQLATVCQDDYYQAWQLITSDYNGGFPIIPLDVKKYRLDIDTEIVIDCSTLFTLIKLEENTGLSYGTKPFIISQRIIDSIRNQLNDLKFNRQGTFSMSITLESVTPVQLPKDFYEKRKNELQNIVDWIDKNTKSEAVPEMFEYCIDAPEMEMNTQSLVETVMLASKPNRALLSDEFLLFGFTINSNIIEFVSIENFLLKFFFSEYEKKYLPELLKLNYRGLTVDASTLQSLFETSNTSLSKASDEHSLFNKSLCGISPLYNDYHENIATVAKFLKSIYSEPSDLWYKQMISRKVLGFLFEGANPTVLPRLEELIEKEFRLLGDHQDHVNDDIKFVLGSF